MIRYLRQEEKRRTLPLWREAFYQDSEAFLEYYYREKTRDNRILAKVEEETGRIVSMVHRNPYRVQAGEMAWDIDYVVAAATTKDRQRQGLMRGLLTRMMEDMYGEEMGFCFLMPADVKIYEPFDFVTICEQPSLKLNPKGERELKAERLADDGRDKERAARWMDRWLMERYQVFARRTPEYVGRLLGELASEDGWREYLTITHPVELGKVRGRDEIQGIRCWWGLGEKEQRMLLAGDVWTKPADRKPPLIMARIIHLKKFLTAIRLRPGSGKEHCLSVRLKVEDSLCRDNEGTFLWVIDRETSRLFSWEDNMKVQVSLKITIAELTGWLFGRGTGLCGENPWMREVQVLDRIFLDEIV